MNIIHDVHCLSFTVDSCGLHNLPFMKTFCSIRISFIRLPLYMDPRDSNELFMIRGWDISTDVGNVNIDRKFHK